MLCFTELVYQPFEDESFGIAVGDRGEGVDAVATRIFKAGINQC